MSEYDDMESLSAYLDKQNLVDKFVSYAEKNGLRRRNLLIKKSRHLLEEYLKSRVIYNILDEEALNMYLNQDDPVVKEALDVFARHASFPQKPQPKAGKNTAKNAKK